MHTNLTPIAERILADHPEIECLAFTIDLWYGEYTANTGVSASYFLRSSNQCHRVECPKGEEDLATLERLIREARTKH